jgi:hypothetical protein
MKRKILKCESDLTQYKQFFYQRKFISRMYRILLIGIVEGCISKVFFHVIFILKQIVGLSLVQWYFNDLYY